MKSRKFANFRQYFVQVKFLHGCLSLDIKNIKNWKILLVYKTLFLIYVHIPIRKKYCFNFNTGTGIILEPVLKMIPNANLDKYR